jgi:hypothetical protein
MKSKPRWIKPRPGLSAASQGNRPLRIVMVNREAFVLTYAWHLTRLFERVCHTGLLEWAFWSYADLDQPSELTAASKAVRVANWVVFCQATPSALPSHIQRWAESWLSQERETTAGVGFFTLSGDDTNSEGKAQARLRKLARDANRAFVGVRDYLWGRNGALRELTPPQRTRLPYE